jgi:nicotinate-nucleotide pyrophosphorylase (carboxylating)
MSKPRDVSNIHDLIRVALEEDLGPSGDITSRAVLDPNARAEALIRSKEKGVVSGTYLLEPLFHAIDPSLAVHVLSRDGHPLAAGTEICRIAGHLTPILAGERVALNFLQRLSGIATQTSRLVSIIKGTRAAVLDTRKTTPGMRSLEKRAVAAGGGQNHRFGLFDMILIKDTHVKACGSPGKAVKKALEFTNINKDIAIEVEVQTLPEFREALEAGPNRIMLDNMGLDEMAECVLIRDERAPRMELEASGNITEHNIRRVAETGVDFISVGSLTHSIRSLDIHLIIS